jgi:hypothetical protein
MKIIFAGSIMSCLLKIIYLIRVFPKLNFLVTMLMKVCSEVGYFMLLFGIFIITFAECNHIMLVDNTVYGRMPELMGHFISVLRGAMGDFSMIDPYTGFDIIDYPELEGDAKYRHSFLIYAVTFVLWGLGMFFLFMIFMNFIIALIGDSFSCVMEFREAHDYKQRIMMIYEREASFTKKDYDNKEYFPNVLIVRTRKENKQDKGNFKKKLTKIKDILKSHLGFLNTSISSKAKE